MSPCRILFHRCNTFQWHKRVLAVKNSFRRLVEGTLYKLVFHGARRGAWSALMTVPEVKSFGWKSNATKLTKNYKFRAVLVCPDYSARGEKFWSEESEM